MAEHTPESDLGSIECFQNYTAPEVFIQGLAGIVDQQDVESMIRAQKQMLQRFEKTNEMLSNCNALSTSRFKVASAELKRHTQLLAEMRKDLDQIFKHIRVIKGKMTTQYPQAFKADPEKSSSVDEEEEAATANLTSTRPRSSHSTDTVVSLHDLNIAEKNDNSNPAGQETEPVNEEEEEEDRLSNTSADRKTLKRANSSSSDSNNGNSNNDSSPYTSDTG